MLFTLVKITSAYVINELQTLPFNIEFLGHSARGTGANIHLHPSWCDCNSYNTSIITFDINPLIVSYPVNINVPNNIELYPGKNIKLNISVFDCNGTASTCIADVFLGCDNELVCHNATAIHLAGPLTVYLSSGVIDIGLVIESTALNHQISTDEMTTQL